MFFSCSKSKWRLRPESNRRRWLCRPLHNHFATQPFLKIKKPRDRGFNIFFGAGNEIRTRDPNLGKVVLYQLSYSRVAIDNGYYTELFLSVNT